MVTPTNSRAPRFLLYSHDSWGLGHLRRSLTLADALTRTYPTASVLIASGSPCATHFALPERCDIVKLPAITKDAQGKYCSRALPLSVEEVVGLRREILISTFNAFAPDALVVDHRVTGLCDEIVPLLHAAKHTGTHTVLGMRDIIDAPLAVEREWDTDNTRWALEHGYDEILVYGEEAIFDPRTEYRMSELSADKVHFTGYLTREVPLARRRALPRPRPEILVTFGGGGDGASRAHMVLDGIELAPTPWETSIVLGPLMDPATARILERRAQAMRDVRITRFEPDLIARMNDADLIVGMAGYNTTTELLATGKPGLLLPRRAPRQEQEIRATRLAARGAAHSLNSPTPLELRAAIATALDSRETARPKLDLAGSLNAARRIGRRTGLTTPPFATA